MKEEERAIMKAKVEEPIVSEQVEMFTAKPVEEEVVFKQVEEEIVSAKQDSEVVVHSNLHAEKEEDMVTMEGNMATVEEDMAAHTPKVEEPIVSEQVEMFNAKPVEEEVVFQQAEVEVITTQDEKVEEVVQDEEQMSNKLVEDEVSLQQVQEEVIINQAGNEEEEEEEVNEEKVSFSMEDLEYDEATGQLFIHLESGMREVTDLQCRNQLLAKMSSIPEDDGLLASVFPSPEARATPTLSQVPDVGEVLSATPPVLLKPINFRLQEQRLTFSHLGQSRAQSLGRWTSWTRDLLISDLEAAFTKPRRSIYWSDFSLEEKLACFDMVDWGATYPLDPPPRSLMFEPAEDHWSTWA